MGEAKKKQGGAGVVNISDRRAASGAEDEVRGKVEAAAADSDCDGGEEQPVHAAPLAQQGDPTPPATGPARREDRNAQFKPCVVNRNALAPLDLIRAGKGTAPDRDRAILEMAGHVAELNGATQCGFFQVTSVMSALTAYLRAEAHWRARFWRRWFTRRPPLPDIAAVMMRARMQFEAEAEAAVRKAAGEQPS